MVVSLDSQDRKIFHTAFALWTGQASERDFLQMDLLRHSLAPMATCSMLKLVTSCVACGEEDLLPESLLEQLRALSWPPLSVFATKRAGEGSPH